MVEDHHRAVAGRHCHRARRLDLRGHDRGQRPLTEARIGVTTQHRLDVRGGAGSMHLHQPPLLGVDREHDPAGMRVDVLPGDDRGRHLVAHALRVPLLVPSLGFP